MTSAHRKLMLGFVTMLLVLVSGCAGPRPAANSPESPAPATPTDDAKGRDIVTTGTVAITVADVDAAVGHLIDLTTGSGGRVDARTESTSSRRSPTAELTVRIPTGQLDTFLADVRSLGEVTSVSVNHSDVTATRIDQDARIAALQASVDRLTALLKSATTTADLLAAEDALAQRQADLDSLRAQRDGLVDRVDYATITATLSAEPVPVSTGFMAAIGRGWGALLACTRALITVVGFLLPWSPVLIIGVLALGARRRFRRRAHPPDPVRQGP